MSTFYSFRLCRHRTKRCPRELANEISACARCPPGLTNEMCCVEPAQRKVAPLHDLAGSEHLMSGPISWQHRCLIGRSGERGCPDLRTRVGVGRLHEKDHYELCFWKASRVMMKFRGSEFNPQLLYDQSNTNQFFSVFPVQEHGGQ